MKTPTTTAGPGDSTLAEGLRLGENILAHLQLDSKTSEPYYKQLKRQINRMIDNGELPAGANLPSERVLAEALQVSRTTIKRCYNDLRQAQRLSTHGRGGTQVHAPDSTQVQVDNVQGCAEEIRALGMAPSSRLVSQEIVQDRMIAAVFERPSVTRFLKLVRLHLANSSPFSRELAWYDLTRNPGMAQWDTLGSATAYLREHCGLHPETLEQTIEAVTSTDVETSAFNFTASSPCLLVKRKTFGSDRQLLEYTESTFRGDAYTYRTRVKP